MLTDWFKPEVLVEPLSALDVLGVALGAALSLALVAIAARLKGTGGWVLLAVGCLAAGGAAHRVFRAIAPGDTTAHAFAFVVLALAAVAVGLMVARLSEGIRGLGVGAAIAVVVLCADLLDRVEEQMATVPIGWGFVLACLGLLFVWMYSES